MSWKSFLSAVNTSAQALTVNSIVSVSELLSNGCAITFGGGTAPIRLRRQGLYLVDVTASILGTTAGDVVLQLLNNSTVIQGATARITVAEGNTYNAHITALVSVPPSCSCQNNSNNIQLQLLNVPATISSVRIDVAKLGCE